MRLSLRHLVDVLRYAHPDFADGPWLRSRALDEAPSGVGRAARIVFSTGLSTLVLRLLVAVDRALPPARWATRLLERERPDAVVVSPLLWWGSLQVDVVKAAAARGVPTAAWIPSWDNLTTKGLLRVVPDRVFVWNDLQREELERYHDVAPARAAVTGAQTFDRWFRPGADILSREAFCRRHDLDSTRPFFLYLGSSKHIAPDEHEFFERWLDAIRSSGDVRVRTAGVLARPHPSTAGGVESWFVRGYEERGVSLWRPSPEASYDGAVDADYRDAFVHAAAAVGINTSAMVEAGIFGLPVCAPLLPELAQRQRGTPHFRLLERAGGAILRLAPTLEVHLADLARCAAGEGGPSPERAASFVARFIRPRGADVPAAECFVEEMRALVGLSEAPVPPRD